MFDWKKIVERILITIGGALLGYFSNGTLTICYNPPSGETKPAPKPPEPLPVPPPRPVPPPAPIPVPPPAPKPAADPKQALGRFRTSAGSGCSITVVGPRATDGYWYALSSAHCFKSANEKLWITVGPLKEHADASVVRLDRDADLALIKIKSDVDLPWVVFAAAAPKAGDEVWHQGYGVNVPGNVERGKIHDPGTASRAQSHSVRLSSGDSGSGLLMGTELVGVNHSGDRSTFYASSWHEVSAFLRLYHPDRAAA